MDPARNPYAPGAGIAPSELAGRAADIAAFNVLATRAEAGRVSQSIVFTGLRGVGKTVLIRHLASTAARRGWLVANVEADRTARAGSFAENLARSMSTSLRQAHGAHRGRRLLQSAGRTLRSFSVAIRPDGSLQLGLDLAPQPGRADTGDLYTDLTDLAVDVATGAQDVGRGAVIFVDEMQDLTPPELSAVCRACHESGQRSLPFFVVGAGLPNLPGQLAGAESYAERLFEYRTIDRLNDVDAAEALIKPALAEGVHWEDDATELVVAKAGGYPYFIQQYGQSAWNASAGPSVTALDARIGIEEGLRKLDAGFFSSRWDRATPAERKYLRAMSGDGDGPSQSGEIARRLGLPASAVGPARAQLIRKGVIYAPEHGRVAFTVPGMASFINRRTD